MADALVNQFPLYSKVRFVLDLTEGVTVPIFGHSNATVSGQTDVKAFTYATTEGGPLAGYHNSSALSFAHTNITQRGKVPGEGSMEVGAIAMIPDGFLQKPAAVNTVLALTGVAPGSHFAVKDAVNGNNTGAQPGTALGYALRMWSKAYIPYVQYGDSGAKTYLGSCQLYPAGRGFFDGHSPAPSGAIFKLPRPLTWSTKGAYSNLIIGFELKDDQFNAPWDATGAAAAATDPGITLRQQLGYAAAGAAPVAAGIVMACLDVKVMLFGQRISLAGD